MSERAFKTFGPETWSRGHRGVLGGHATDLPSLQDVRFYPNGRIGPRHPWVHRKNETAYTGNYCPLFIPLLYKEDSTDQTTGVLSIDEDGDVRWTPYSDFAIDYTDLTAFTFPGGVGAHTDPQQLWVSYIDEWTVLVNDHVISVEQQVPAAGGGPLFVSKIDFTAAPFSFSATYHCYGSVYHNTRGFFWGDDQNESGTSVISGNLNRIYYTNAANDPTAPGFGTQQPPTVTFNSATQYFDIDGPVAGAVSVDGNLLIWDKTGVWYLLQGRGDPADGTLLRLGAFRLPAPDAPVIVEMNRQFYFLSAGPNSITRVSPNGQMDDTTYSYLQFAADDSGYDPSVADDVRRPASSTIHNVMWLPQENEAFHLFNGVWTLEDSDLQGPLKEDYQLWIDERNGYEYLAVQDATNTDIYRRELSPAEPLFNGGIVLPDDSESPDPSAANSAGSVYAKVKLPRIQEPHKSIRVRRVIVDGYYHDTYYAPSYTVRVYLGDRSGTNQVTVDFNRGPTQHVADIASIPAGQEYPFRAVHTPETDGMVQYTSFVEVELRHLVSVSIEKVTVEYEINKGFVF